LSCEHFSNGRSFFHRCDPRVKLLCLLVGSWIIATLETLEFQLACLLLSSAFMFAAKLPLKETGLRLLIVNTFCLFIWLTVPLTTSGSPFFHIIGLYFITTEGVISALSITLKSNAIVFLSLSLLSTSKITDLTHALSHLKCPSPLVQLFYFTWRYIHVISEEAKKINEAMKLRGFSLSTNLSTYKYIGNYISAIFLKSYDTGIQVQRAMELRGFDGTFWLIHHFNLKRSDIVFFTTTISAILLIFIGDHFILSK